MEKYMVFEFDSDLDYLVQLSIPLDSLESAISFKKTCEKTMSGNGIFKIFKEVE